MEEVTAAIDEREREREENEGTCNQFEWGGCCNGSCSTQREPVQQKSPTITVTDLRASWPFKLSNFEFFSIFFFLTNHNNRTPNNNYLSKEALITPIFKKFLL